MAIIRVRRVVKNQTCAVFEDEGGHIESKATGMRIPLFEHEGVYVLKLKIKKPADPAPETSHFTRPVKSKSPTGSARPGR